MPEDQKQRDEKYAPPSAPLPRQGTILIVEDDEFLRRLLVDKFTKEGYAVETAENGEQALKQTKKNLPNLMLLDLLMPGMDGFQVLEAIRKDPATKALPVVVLSNLGEAEHMNRAKALEVEDYLIKAHLFLDEIVQKVDEIIKKRRIPSAKSQTNIQ